jgi:SnoaL-like domain
MTNEVSSERAIENLIARYSFLVDEGDFVGLGELLAACSFTLGTGPTVRGSEAIVQLARGALMTYDDGTPRTRHVTTNILIEVDDAQESARSQSYYTVLQSLPDFPLQPIVCGTYRDLFVRKDGVWSFKERSVQPRFAGDTSRHRRQAQP